MKKDTKKEGTRRRAKQLPRAREALPREHADFLSALSLAMNEAHKLGMHQTGHALHEALRIAGFEVANCMSKHLRMTRSMIEQAARLD